jgi:hypothetical protein
MIAASRKVDFKDWLSPMLVKELRQGMRSRVFVSAFYLSQALMILSTVLQMVSSSATDRGDLAGFLNAVFWFLIGLPLLFLMPLRGFSALYGEMKGGTLELVFLTRLSAWKITVGKWLALVVQTLLLICSILPYVVLRYFVGGVNLVDDAQKVLFLLVGSALLTATTIALSPYESKLVRALFVLGMIFAVQFIAGIFFTWLAVGQFSPTGLIPWAGYVAGLVFVVAFILLALQLAASKIAPPAENHACIKRLIGLAVLLFAGLFAAFGVGSEEVMGVALLFLLPVIVDALAEPMRFVRGYYEGFRRLGPLAGLLRIFFVPGWVSGLCYTTLIGVLFLVCGAISGLWTEASFMIVAVSFFGTLLFPAALIRLFAPTAKNFLGIYIALQFAIAALTLLIGIMGGITDQPFQSWLCWLPGSVLLWGLVSMVKAEDLALFMTATSFMTLLSLLILFVKSVRPSRDIRAQLRQTPSSHV